MTLPPPPLGPGVHALGDTLVAGLYSANATGATFCLYDAEGGAELERIPLERGEDGLFRGSVAGVGVGARYGFRVEGAFDPANGHRFDPSKLLADPYAVAFDRPFVLHESMFAYGHDSGSFAPKAIVGGPAHGEPGRRRIPDERLVIYELNVRGFTMLHPGVAEEKRGRFAALAEPAVLEHLQKLGVTAVEFMPADAFVDERHLPPLGLSNAWGYNPVVLGAPDPRLAPDGWSEVRLAADALHAVGIEAILDIVLNHNGESDEFGPTLSFRGLDNASYFRLLADDPARYVNDAGTGNCLRLDFPPVVAMAIAAMRRWMTFGGVDGFRFDLATALGRRANGFDPHAPILAAIAEDPLLSRARLIAEPWDVGPGGYCIGRFPESFGEWNDRFRDTARRFWRGDAGLRGDLATRIAGSRDLFPTGAGPTKSVNFVVAHDGFTLADLVSYSSKHNEANGEHNRDGADENYSWNNGVEGPTADEAVRRARLQDQRNLLALLSVARGVPMLTMGAELGHSQNGNNNAYAQNNETTWIDWRSADPDLINFARRAIAARRDHPALRADIWLKGRAIEDGDALDVEWRDAEGPLSEAGQWERQPGDDLVVALAAPNDGGVDRCLLAFNRGRRNLRASLPPAQDGMAWTGLFDTTKTDGAPTPLAIADAAILPARSTLAFAEKASKTAPPRAALVDALAEAAGVKSEWHDIAGRRTVVAPDTKIAILKALGFPAGSASEARDSLARLVHETSGRPLPASIVGRVDRPLSSTLRSDPGGSEPRLDYVVVAEGGRTIEGRAQAGDARREALPNGRTAIVRDIALPDLPTGRHRLRMAGVESWLTVAPAAGYFPAALSERRFGLAAQLYAQRRPPDGAPDQGLGDLTTLRILADHAAGAGAAALALNPLHALFPTDRTRFSPYSPSDRRFIDPIHIDALDGDGLPSDEEFAKVAANEAGRIAALGRLAEIDYEAAWETKRRLLEARFKAFARARAARPDELVFADFTRFREAGGETLRRFALHSALAGGRLGADWRRWPEALRDAEASALREAEAADPQGVAFALFLQWLADRQLARAAKRARAAGLDVGLYRDLAVGAAPDGAEAWSRAHELAIGVAIGAPPDPFSEQGQNWNIPPPNPIAGARDGWRGFAELFRANMRHAGILRIDHAMGLSRLFVLPDGGSPADGAYLTLPFEDLIGNVALESQRAECAVVGEDLGTVPEGFRAATAERNVLGMRVLWFERENAGFAPPSAYPSLSVASVSTHDLPTLAGWWTGADIGERLMLGLLAAAAAREALDSREREKRALVETLLRDGRLAQPPDFAAPMSDVVAAATHRFLATAGSLLALAQLDDLVGETIGTNLPGTDRERANWRRRLKADVRAAVTGQRGTAVIDALREVRSERPIS